MVQNGKPLGQMLIKLSLDSSAFSDSLTGAQRATKTAVREMQSGFKVAAGGATTLSSLASKQQGLTKVIQAQEKELGYLKNAYDKTLDSQGNATSKTAAAAQKYNEAQAKLAGYKQEMVNTAGAMAEMKVKTEGATGAINAGSEKMIASGKAMQSMGSALTKGVTLPIVAGAAAVTKAAVSWESDFAGVKKTNDEVVDSTGKVVYSYKDLENGLKDLATQLPASHKEIAGVAEAAGQLGIKTENVKSFTKTMIEMGMSTDLSAEQAAKSMARFANITGMSQKDFDKLGSSLVDLGNNFASTEPEIMDMSLRLAGAGKQVGMTEGDILGLSTALSSVGIEAEAGGSAFSKVMIQMQLAVEKGSGAFEDLRERAADAGISMEQLQVAIRNGGKDQKAVAEAMGMTSSELKKMYKEADKSKTSLENFSNVAGMTSEQFSKLFKDDPTKAITTFIQGLKDSEKHGTSAIKVLDDMDIKEVRLRDSLLRAANASGVFDRAIQTGNKAWKENTALTEEAGKRINTTESQLKLLKGQINNVAITLGRPMLEALNSTISVSKPLIKNIAEMADKFNDASPKTQQMILKLAAFAAAAGPVLSVTGKMSSGIGSLGKSFVELSASMAKKKAITEMTKELATSAVNADTFSVALGGGATKMGLFGSAASTAAGSSGLGAMAASLGPLGPSILGIVGVGGALAIGYGAWKTFGEEAWNSSQRVKQWGTDVGATTDATLDKVQSNTQQASGQFGLMAAGLSNNTSGMVSNLETIGSTIETALTKRMEAFNTAISMVPDELKNTMETIAGKAKEETQKALDIVQENNERILQIKQNYVDKDGQTTLQGAKMIQDLMKQSTEEYLKITVNDADARRKVMDALNGDIEKATQEQAKSMLQTLGKQRQETKASYSQQLEDFKGVLKEQGILNTEYGQQMVKAFEEARDSSTDAFDQQMAHIVEKYPELLDEISLVNGQVISSSGEMSSAMIAENEKIIGNAKVLSDKLSESARNNAETLSWTANEATKAGETWNALELLDKDGKVKTNASEIVAEATKDINVWNNLKVLVHDADLDSNAKRVIGEAAIVNGYWNGMAFEDKKAILQDEFSITMYEALKSTGAWDNMSVEAKTAFLYSNTPEVMAETLLNLGLWNDFLPNIKELNAKNEGFLQVLSTSEEKLQHWSSIPSDVKEIIGDNYDFLQKVYESDLAYTRWKDMPETEKRLLANNTEFLQTILTSETKWTQWNSIPDDQKNMLASNEDLLNKIFSSKENYNAWVLLPDNLKKLMGENSDLLEKLNTGEIKLNEFDANNPALKQLLGDSYNVQEAASQGENAINSYKRNNAPDKYLNGNSTNVQNASTQGERSLNLYSRNNPSIKNLTGNASSVNSATTSGGSSLNRYAGNNPGTKYLTAFDNASGPAVVATNGVVGFARQSDHTVTLTTRIKRIFETIGDAFGFKNGTNFFKGGDMIVNDQRGPLYKELIEFPNGMKFIPEGRNVFIPNAPKGTKVYTASQTKRMIPHYANGVGVSSDSEFVRYANDTNRSMNNTIEINQDNQRVEALLLRIANSLESIMSSPSEIIMETDLREIARGTLPYQEKLRNFNEAISTVMRGET
ncbi:phage tail tape measure protein [Enterococcus sp. AZ072]|uniref:phage tail tape measure protein n=1 Tax=unclassified Enterococcus TaxID=2608891 RepID=UPI003D27EEEF